MATRAASISYSDKFADLRWPVLITVALIVHFLAFVFNVVAFVSPYWLASEFASVTPFRHLGLWQACFNPYSAAKLLTPQERLEHTQNWTAETRQKYEKEWTTAFEGCNDYHSYYMEPLYQRLKPDWFMTTQAFMTIGMTLSVLNLIVLPILIFVRPSRRFYRPLLYNARWIEGFAAVSVVISLVVFGFNSHNDGYLPDTKWNHLAWAYWLAVVSLVLHTLALVVLILDFRRRQDAAEKRIGKIQHHIQMTALAAAAAAMPEAVRVPEVRIVLHDSNNNSSTTTPSPVNIDYERVTESRASRFTNDAFSASEEPSPPPETAPDVENVAAATEISNGRRIDDTSVVELAAAARPQIQTYSARTATVVTKAARPTFHSAAAVWPRSEVGL